MIATGVLRGAYLEELMKGMFGTFPPTLGRFDATAPSMGLDRFGPLKGSTWTCYGFADALGQRHYHEG